MVAMVTVVANPFDPVGSRRSCLVRRRARVRAFVPKGSRPVIALLNGRPLLRAGWRRRLRDGDSLVFCVLPRDRQGSNPLRILLSIALLVFAPWAAGGLLGAAGIASGAPLIGSFTYGMAATLGIHLVGSAILNALLPMPTPGSLPAPSPTYSLGAQGNAARTDQAIPVQYGRLLVYPDIAAQPYIEFAGNEQYLYQLFCLGCGEFDIEDIRIEDTPTSSFTEIETEIVAPGAQVTLFPSNVITSVEVSGQELLPLKAGTWAQSGTTITVTETAHGRATGQAVDLTFTSGGGPDEKYAIATVIDENGWTVTAATSATASGAVEIRPIMGGLTGFTASGPGTVAHRLAVDLVYPLGLFSVGGGGEIGNVSVPVTIQARRIDDDGAPLAAWFDLGTETVTDRSTTPQRRTFFYDLATPGRYQVRAWRLNALHPSTGAGDQVLLAGLRSYLRETEDFGPVTLIAMRMRATNNLSQQASRKVAVLATRKLPVWTGSSWSSPVATRSIAWALADAARNADYGAGLADARVDLAALLDLDAVWTARGDRFDGRFDQTATWWEAASRIAAAGRARTFMQGGTLRVVRDGPVTLPVAMFSMRNIRRGSFAIDYLMPSEDTADAVTVKYFDETTWTTRRVTAALPGSTAAKPFELDFSRAVTNRGQALREAFYHAASNRYRRRIVRFSTEMEGFIPSIGDLVSLQHDMPGWGVHAEAVAWSAGARRLTLTEPLTFAAGSHYVGLRKPDGGLSGPWEVSPGANAHEVILAEAPDITPQTGGERERTHVVFGPGQSWSALAKVARVRPRQLYDVEIEAVIEDGAVHVAEEGQTPPPMRVSTLPGVITRPVVSGLLARLMPGETTRAVLAWQPAPWADIYQIEMAEGDDPEDPDVSWTRTADTTAAHHVITLLYANRTMVRVRALGLAAGPWVSATLGSLIEFMWSPDDSTLMWALDDSTLMWSS